jgi:hypothetical protein
MISLGSWPSKLLALAVLLLALAPVTLISNRVLQYFQQDEARRAELVEQYVRMQSFAAMEPAQKEGAAASAPESEMFLGLGTSAVLSAALQERLRALAGQKTVDIQQAAELEPVTDESGLTRVGLHLEMSGPPEGLHQLLADIATATPALFVDNVSIRSGYVEAADAQFEPPMSVALDVWGYASQPLEKSKS